MQCLETHLKIIKANKLSEMKNKIIQRYLKEPIGSHYIDFSTLWFQDTDTLTAINAIRMIIIFLIIMIIIILILIIINLLRNKLKNSEI